MKWKKKWTSQDAVIVLLHLLTPDYVMVLYAGVGIYGTNIVVLSLKPLILNW